MDVKIQPPGHPGGPYLQTDDALWNDAQTSQRGRVVCQTLPIDGEVLVKRGHREGVHNLQGERHGEVSFVCAGSLLHVEQRAVIWSPRLYFQLFECLIS